MMEDSKNNNRSKGLGQQVIKKIEKLLFEPSAVLTDPSDRLYSYVTSILLFIVLLGMTYGVVRTLRNNATTGSISSQFLLVGEFFILGGYILSRTKYYSWGLMIAFIPMMLLPYNLILNPPTDIAQYETLNKWMIVPMLVGGLLMSRTLYRLMVVAVLSAPIIQIFTTPPEAGVLTMVIFLFISAVLVDYTARFRARLETQSLTDLQVKNLAEKEGIIQQLQKAEALQQQRARIMEDSYEINSKLATILEPQKLVNEAVNLIQSLLNYNYVQFYLMDESEKTLVLAGGTGQAGQELFSRGHTVAVEKGLVGQAATTNAPVLVSDVSEMDTWVANPLLPNTQSELAVPISVGDVVLGVLDVQEDRKDAFSEEDMALLQSVATAAALSLQNARLYALAQQSAKYEAVLNQINQQVVAAPNMERVLQVAAQTLGSSLNVRRATVQLSRRPGNGRFQEKN